MKIRNSFVSNSSSSSFIVAFDKVPQTVGEMMDLLFAGEESYLDPYYDPSFDYFAKRTPAYPASRVAATVFNDVMKKEPLDEDGIKEAIRNGYFPGFPQPDWEEGLSVLDCNDFLADIWMHPKTVAWRTRLLENKRNCPYFKLLSD